MDRREFLALAASVPIFAGPAHADDDADSTPAEPESEESAGTHSDTVVIDVQLR